MNAKLRRICITAGIVIVSLILLLIVGYTQLMSYLQGDTFRQRMADSARKALQAATLNINSNLSINGSRISIEGASLSSMHNIQEARAGRTSAEINRTALFSRRLHLRKLSLEEANLAFSTGSVSSTDASAPGQPAKKNSKSTSTKQSSNPKKNTSRFSIKDIQLDLFECKDADLHITHNGKPYQLLGANVTATPAPRIGQNAWQINAENARLHTPFHFLRDTSIKSATLVYLGQSADITECRIMLTPGEMRVKAHYDAPKSLWNIDMQVNKGNLHRLLNEDWKKRATGDLYGRLTLTGRGSQTVTGTGAFSLKNGTLEGLPFLSQLPIGNTYPYRSIELEKADCQILFPYASEDIKNAWLFDKINIRARDDSMLVRGHVLIGTDRSLGGTLTIGLPKSIVTALALPQENLTNKLFTASGDDSDYLWLNMNLSGTIDNPKEDLSIRVSTLIGNSLTEFIKDIPKASASDLLDILLKQKSKSTEEQEPTETQSSSSPIRDAANAAGSLLQSLF